MKLSNKFRDIVIYCVLFFASTAVNAQKKMVCYWYAEIDASQINPTICTHIIYSFLGIDSQGGINHLHRSEAQALGYITKLVNLKAQNSNLKLIAAVGGYNENLVPTWSALAGNSNTRSNFARNVLSFLQRTSLNGIDIDWEYPNFSGSSGQDVNNFVLLLQTLKQTLGPSYSVSVAIGAGDWRTGLSYDIPNIFANCDFVNLMSYDLHGGWETKTGIHAGLYSSSLDPTSANVDYSVQLLLRKGISRDKLIMGIPAYGNVFRLANSNNNGVGAAASGAGSWKFNEICPRVKSGSLNYRWDDAQKVPYAFSGSDWVGYDDVRSVTEKANYIVNQNLGGAMFWSIDSEDFSNACGYGRYPLITAVSNIVIGKGSSGGATNPPATNPPATNPPITNSPTTQTPGSFTCPGNGLFKHPSDCSKFYNCWSGVFYLMACPAGLNFNDVIKNCDWPYNVKC